MMNKEGQAHFGEHLMLDGYSGSFEKLNDKELVLASLNELPEMLGMHKLAEPEVYFAEGNGGKDPGGWSGFVVIMESHISIHTFPARGFVSIDAYTCKNGLDTERIIGYFVNRFELKDTEVNLIERGKRYSELAKMQS
jgi:S-adenosylmethionine decarboxylase